MCVTAAYQHALDVLISGRSGQLGRTPGKCILHAGSINNAITSAAAAAAPRDINGTLKA